MDEELIYKTEAIVGDRNISVEVEASINGIDCRGVLIPWDWIMSCRDKLISQNPGKI